jgi:hypothetical protein
MSGDVDALDATRTAVARVRRRHGPRIVGLIVAGLAAIVALAAFVIPRKEARVPPTPAAAGPTVMVFGSGGLSLTDSPGHAAVLALREDPDNHKEHTSSAATATTHLLPALVPTGCTARTATTRSSTCRCA